MLSERTTAPPDLEMRSPAAEGTAHGADRKGRVSEHPINNPSPQSPQAGPNTVTLFVTPKPADKYAVHVGDDCRLVCASSRQPLLDAARFLLSEGLDPSTLLVMRRSDGIDALRGKVGSAARLTVDERKTCFARWRPFSQSAGSSGNEPIKPAGIAPAGTPQAHKEDSAALVR